MGDSVTLALPDRLAREVVRDVLNIRQRLDHRIAAAVRAALAEAAMVARHPKWTDDSDSYVQTAAHEIAAAIEALKE